MKLAVMQPYLFPYIGYYQLIYAVDEFIFLDDVNYINRGWINRNRIIVNSKEFLFTVPLKDASQNRTINSIEILKDNKWQKNMLKTLEMSYKKARYFSDAFPMLESIILSEEQLINEFITNSFRVINKYLNIDTPLLSSSLQKKDMDLKGQDRILDLCLQRKADEYINPPGGVGLYSKDAFLKNNIQLHFIQTGEIKYNQFQPEFVPFLSIVDVLMFNSPETITDFLTQYTLSE